MKLEQTPSPDDFDGGKSALVWIASEPTSTKIYTANKGSGNVSIIQTQSDSLVINMNAPPQDPNCSSSCSLQQPMMILTY